MTYTMVFFFLIKNTIYIYVLSGCKVVTLCFPKLYAFVQESCSFNNLLLFFFFFFGINQYKFYLLPINRIFTLAFFKFKMRKRDCFCCTKIFLFLFLFIFIFIFYPYRKNLVYYVLFFSYFNRHVYKILMFQCIVKRFFFW